MQRGGCNVINKINKVGFNELVGSFCVFRFSFQIYHLPKVILKSMLPINACIC